MQISIINGIYTDENSDFRTSYPKNLVPVPLSQGISSGYLRPSEGIETFATVNGIDRGGINWNNVCYRVVGTKLLKVNNDGSFVVIGDVGGKGQVSMDYSFDYLAITSSGNLFLYDGATLAQNTDPDLGVALDVQFVDGRFMTTDGENLVITELGNPFAVDPFKYGSSEVDPDPIKAVKKIRNEIYAVNRHTIEVFDNVGAENFPFQRIEGAQIQKGTIGTHSTCVFEDVIAFLGSGRNESPSIYLGANGQAIKIATREIDLALQEYTELQLSKVLLEERIDDDHKMIYIHLPDKTLVYDATASSATGQSIWYVLSSSLLGESKYRAKNHVWCYDKWIVGDTNGGKLGSLTEVVSSHYGDEIGWEFSTPIVYNESNGAIFHELELVCLSGRANLGDDPVVWTSYSTDGEVFSQEKSVTVGKIGERNKRITWFQQGVMDNWRIQKFRGTSKSMLSIARLEARLEPLAY